MSIKTDSKDAETIKKLSKIVVFYDDNSFDEVNS